ALRPERSLSHDPLARIGLSFLAAHAATLALPGVEASYAEIPNGGAKFDLNLIVTEHAEDLSCSAEYNGDIFDAPTIERLLGHYGVLLESAGTDPDERVRALPMLPLPERRRLLVEWNDTARHHPTDALVHEVFAAQAARTPEAVAIRFEGRDVSY